MRMWVQSLAPLSGLRVRCCHELWCRLQMENLDLTLLWLWHRLVAIALIRPLAWEPPYATSATPPPKKEYSICFIPGIFRFEASAMILQAQENREVSFVKSDMSFP